MKSKFWYYEKIIKEARLKEKWLKNEEITKAEVLEMIYIDKKVKVEQ